MIDLLKQFLKYFIILLFIYTVLSICNWNLSTTHWNTFSVFCFELAVFFCLIDYIDS